MMILKTIFIFLMLLPSISFAYVDSDFDGVDDAVDRCPNTPFIDLVDINGCSTKSLESPNKFDMIVGLSYSDSSYQVQNQTRTLSTSLQFDYYYKNFSLQLSTSYFKAQGDNYEQKSFNDSFIGASYQFTPLKSLSVRLGAGALLPTYKTSLNNNKIDYTSSINLSYSLKSFNLFAGYSYTLVNDNDVTLVYANNQLLEIKYQNTYAWSTGVGYYLSDKLYGNIAYNLSESSYKSYEDIKSVSMYLYYSVNKHWFSTLSYARGVSQSASQNYASLRVGYFF